MVPTTPDKKTSHSSALDEIRFHRLFISLRRIRLWRRHPLESTVERPFTQNCLLFLAKTNRKLFLKTWKLQHPSPKNARKTLFRWNWNI